jgi:hypothetical protein
MAYPFGPGLYKQFVFWELTEVSQRAKRSLSILAPFLNGTCGSAAVSGFHINELNAAARCCSR